MTAMVSRDPLMPRSAGLPAPGAALSLVAHAALVAALAYGVNWRSPAPTPISAELWAALPQAAAPPSVEPAPTRAATSPPPAVAPRPAPAPVEKALPPDPQIAIEKARREKAQKARADLQDQARQDKLDRDKAQKEKAASDKLRLANERAAAEARAKAEDDARLAKQREDNLRRMMGQIGGTGEPSSRGTAPVAAAPSAAYAGRLVKAIKDNLKFDWRGAGNPAAVVEVRASPSGTILGSTVVKGSGVKEWDEAILRAIDATARLPADADGRVPTSLTITFRPLD